MRVTKQEIWERCQEAVPNDITGEATAESMFSSFHMENDYSKTLDRYYDDDEFITDWDKIVAVDEASELITYEKGIEYLNYSDLFSEFKEYAIGDIADRCARVGEKLLFTSDEWEKALVKFISEDVESYIDWLWEEK